MPTCVELKNCQTNLNLWKRTSDPQQAKELNFCDFRKKLPIKRFARMSKRDFTFINTSTCPKHFLNLFHEKTHTCTNYLSKWPSCTKRIQVCFQHVISVLSSQWSTLELSIKRLFSLSAVPHKTWKMGNDSSNVHDLTLGRITTRLISQTQSSVEILCKLGFLSTSAQTEVLLFFYLNHYIRLYFACEMSLVMMHRTVKSSK